MFEVLHEVYRQCDQFFIYIRSLPFFEPTAPRIPALLAKMNLV